MAKLPSLLVSAALGFSAPAIGQEIIGLSPFGDVHTINPSTGSSTFLGWTWNFQALWTGLAKDSQGRLYASYGRYDTAYQIHEIDPLTGQSTFVCQTDLFGIGGLAFGPGDQLYAANDRTTPSNPHPYDLYTVDLQTGGTSLVGAMGVNIVTSLNFGRGQMWSYSEGGQLGTVDLVSGNVTPVDPSFQGPWIGTDSMCFTDDGTLFQMNSWLWVMDTDSGVPSMIGDLTPHFFSGGMEFLPHRPEPFTVWTSGVTGGPMEIKVSGATPGGSVAVAYAWGDGGPTTIPPGHPCAGLTLDLNQGVSLQGIHVADAEGQLTIGPATVPASAAMAVRLQAVDLTTCSTSNRIMVVY